MGSILDLHQTSLFQSKVCGASVPVYLFFLTLFCKKALEIWSKAVRCNTVKVENCSIVLFQYNKPSVNIKKKNV